MADVAVTYTLSTGFGTIAFNDGATDEYFITDIQGLDSRPIRSTVDSAPQSDGGIVHDFFFSARHIVVDGIFFIRSTRVGDQIQTQRNQMEASLLAALESIIRSDGTLDYTPLGGDAVSLPVRYEVPLELRYIDNYLNKSFTFGLVDSSLAL